MLGRTWPFTIWTFILDRRSMISLEISLRHLQNGQIGSGSERWPLNHTKKWAYERTTSLLWNNED